MLKADPNTNSLRNSIKRFLSGQETSDGLREYLIKGTAGSFLLQIAGTGLGFLAQLMLARFLGAEEYGVYTYVFAWVGLLVVLSRFGSGGLLMREIAAYTTTERGDLTKGLLRWVGQWTLCLSILVAIVASAVAWLVRGSLNPLIFPAIWLGFAAIPLMTLSYLTNPAMTGFRHVVLGKIPGSLARWVLFIVFLLAFYWFSSRILNAAWAAGLNLIVFIVVLTLSIWLLYSILPEEVLQARASYRHRVWLMSALPLLFIEILNEAYFRTPTIMLEALAGPAETGVFGITYLLTGLSNFIMLPLIFALGPVISSLYISKDMARLQRIITFSTRVALILAFVAATMLIVFRQWIILLLGPDYEQISSLLVILSIGQLLIIALGPVIILLTMTSHEKDVAVSLATLVLLNIVCNYFFIQLWGANGAGLATVIIGVLWSSLLSIQVYRRLGIDSTAFGLLRLYK